jgi:predicted ATP-dependent endonuclease of OLD family
MSVRVENFRCIEDSTEFSIEPVTCLVGKNEAGKTALLQALYKLKPDIAEKGDFDPILDYPRRRYSEYKERHETNPDNVLTTVWELEEKDIDAVAKVLGSKALKGNTLRITKGYSNIRTWDFEIDESEVVKHFLRLSGLNQTERADIKDSQTLDELITKLEAIGTKSESQQTFLNTLKQIFSAKNPKMLVTDILNANMPTFLYFGDYQNLPGKVSINELKRKIAERGLKYGDRVFLALLDLASTSLDEIVQMKEFEKLNAELEAVSNRLSDEIFEYWSQNRNLKVICRFDNALPDDPPPFNSGYVFRTRIENVRHRVTVSFDEHSRGFVWFFSFLVWFSQLKKHYGKNLIILLDDPALSLHARAQADLLRYINEKLKPNFQVIYTTHSPFMVDAENLLRVRTVEDVFEDQEIKGTKVGDEVLSTDRDTLFPLQAALGYDITQTLFVGPHTLLVEGPSDILYLQWLSNELKNQDRTFLDSRWILTPCGGIDKIASFLALFSGARLHIAVFTDFHEGDKRKVRELKQSVLLKKGHVFSAEMFINQNEADTEDLIGRSNYIVLVNTCYSLPNTRKLPIQKPPDAPVRVLEEVKNHFNTLPNRYQEFDHYTPALFLMSNTDALRSALPDLGQALDRFEKLFEGLNELLSE